MKQRIYYFGTLFFIIITSLYGCKAKELSISDKAKINDITQAVESRRYTFEPTSATPASYKMINLQPGYYLKISPDTIKAYLPYYGRSYSAPMDPTKIGIDFTSTNFDYNVDTKKDRWEIKIKPKDANSNYEMFLTVGNTGYTSLRVFDNNRQNISFYGSISE